MGTSANPYFSMQRHGDKLDMKESVVEADLNLLRDLLYSIVSQCTVMTPLDAANGIALALRFGCRLRRDGIGHVGGWCCVGGWCHGKKKDARAWIFSII